MNRPSRYRLLWAAPLVLLLARKMEAKPRPVHLIPELKEAKVVAPVRIVSYENEGLRCVLLEGPPRSLTFKYSSDPTWNPSRFAKSDLSLMGTGRWPAAGSEVLVAADKNDLVSLFAYRQGDQWRFWSPIETGSVALFECNPPSTPIKRDAFIYKNGSWDGCLFPAQALKQWYIGFKHR